LHILETRGVKNKFSLCNQSVVYSMTGHQAAVARNINLVRIDFTEL
jgi:hypothetical protein